jgi:uncharacterized protein DUF4349
MTPITHPFAPEEIMALLDGELPTDGAQSVSSHINKCAECELIAESLRTTSRNMAAWTVGTLRRDIFADTETTTRAQKLKSSFSALRDLLSQRWIWAPALSVVVTLIAFVAIPHSDGPQSGMGTKLGRNRTMGALIGGVPGGLPANGPMIARTVSLSIVLKDFDAGRASLDTILARHNGYAASLNVSTPQGAARTLQASLRIPAPQLAAALSELKALGRVENENQNGEEVTQQHADLVARLKNSRETEQRLQDVLRTRTGKVKDVLEVEEEIARVRGEFEQMEAEQKTLEHRVDFATIDLKLAEEYKAQLSTPAPSVAMQLRNAAVNGFRNAFESLLALVLFLAESGPSLLLWLALLGIPAWRLWKRYRRAQTLAPLAGA